MIVTGMVNPARHLFTAKVTEWVCVDKVSCVLWYEPQTWHPSVRIFGCPRHRRGDSGVFNENKGS